MICQFETGTSVYILDGGKVETAKGNSRISVIGTSRSQSKKEENLVMMIIKISCQSI